MSEQFESVGAELVKRIKHNTGIVIAIGVVLLIVGILALVAPFVAGLSVAFVVGILLLIGGIAQLLFAFKAGSFGKGLLAFILGALTMMAGVIMISRPDVGLATLTLFLAAYFIAEGVFEALWAFQLKPVQGWGWSLFSGIVSLLLGIMIWRQFPLSGAWAVGVLVGIKLIFSGWTLITIGGAARAEAPRVWPTPDNPAKP